MKKTEEEIQVLELRDREIDQLLQQEAIFTDTGKLMELHQEKETLQNRLDFLYEQWEELA